MFAEWNKGELGNYLIGITADIFTKLDSDTGRSLIEVILDTADQKGTGMGKPKCLRFGRAIIDYYRIRLCKSDVLT